jgi:hypothetical protein
MGKVGHGWHEFNLARLAPQPHGSRLCNQKREAEDEDEDEILCQECGARQSRRYEGFQAKGGKTKGKGEDEDDDEQTKQGETRFWSAVSRADGKTR